MRYEVLISSIAQQEAQTNHDWWAANPSNEQACLWYDAFVKAAFSLEDNPARFTLAPENGRFPYEVRQLNFGVGRKPTHRIVYTVRSKEVVVLRVRHLAQQDIE